MGLLEKVDTDSGGFDVLVLGMLQVPAGTCSDDEANENCR
jgi:hypothetical protein